MSKPKIALLVETINVHDIRRIVGSFVRFGDDGERLNVTWSRFDENASVCHLAGLRVHAYVGERKGFGSTYENGRIWGCGYSYENVYSIEQAAQARDMANALGRIERGMSKLNEDNGYVADGDFFTYAVRVASILKVTDFQVRNLRSAQEQSGERYRRVNGSALQWYVNEVEALAHKREYAELNERR